MRHGGGGLLADQPVLVETRQGERFNQGRGAAL
jgi:hypothetical protein